MHTLEENASLAAGSISDYQPCIKFAPGQNVTFPTISALLANHTKRQQFFYSIEISALTRGKPTCLDFNEFLPVLPAFISLVWLGLDYWNVPLEQVYTLQLARYLEKHIPVMPHLSAYRLSEQRLDKFLDLNFSNVLAVRGDIIHEEQTYRYSRQLVKHMREKRSDSISICAPGYPEGYTTNQDVIQDPKRNMEYLKEKVQAGADFIITQTCYSSEALIQFVKDCRQAGITVPIILGLVVPDSLQNYLTIQRLSGARLPQNLLMELEKLKDDQNATAKFFVQLTLNNILQVREANVGIQGVHFFTMNRFGPIKEVLKELHVLQILRE